EAFLRAAFETMRQSTDTGSIRASNGKTDQGSFVQSVGPRPQPSATDPSVAVTSECERHAGWLFGDRIEAAAVKPQEVVLFHFIHVKFGTPAYAFVKIGRASCRERVLVYGGGVSLK